MYWFLVILSAVAVYATVWARQKHHPRVFGLMVVVSTLLVGMTLFVLSMVFGHSSSGIG